MMAATMSKAHLDSEVSKLKKEAQAAVNAALEESNILKQELDWFKAEKVRVLGSSWITTS